ncbi:hypothetical protein P3T18_001612 [Paraburkholderia sp. GAS199]|uniref:hypothetical protein n=1 Tax=Paraburkholderia sp. GAS199 TaxID=3035126 RepID=UPI003D1E163F
MTNFLIDLISNLALLAFVLIACALCNRLIPGTVLDGARIFAALAVTALIFDAALTFVVFADAQTRYGKFSTTDAFLGRAGAYALAAVIALTYAKVDRRLRAAEAKPNAGDKIVIHTSPYSESHLPM